MSDRPYRAPLHNGEVYRLLRDEAGAHFDPKIVVASSDVGKRVEKIQVDYRKRQAARRLFPELSHPAFEVIL